MFARPASRFTACALAWGLAVAPATARAEPMRAASAVAASARQAYEVGNFAQAAALYMQAWKLVPAQTGLLYNAARAGHLAGQIDDAEANYRQFLALPDHDRAVDGKIQGFLDEIRLHRADVLAESAAKAMAAGHADTAAEQYRAALDAAPERLEWLPKLAAAEGAAGHPDQGRRHLRAYLDRAPADAPGRVQARLRLTELETPAEPQASAGGQAPGWIALGLGVGAGATAGWLWWLAQGEQEDLNKRLAIRDAQGTVTGVDYPSAVRDHDQIGQHLTAAAVTGGAAVVLTAVGAWWLGTHGAARVAALPAPGGAILTARF